MAILVQMHLLIYIAISSSGNKIKTVQTYPTTLRRIKESHTITKEVILGVYESKGSENCSPSSGGREETSMLRKEAPPFIAAVANFPNFLWGLFFAVIICSIALSV